MRFSMRLFAAIGSAAAKITALSALLCLPWARELGLTNLDPLLSGVLLTATKDYSLMRFVAFKGEISSPRYSRHPTPEAARSAANSQTRL